MDKDDGEVTKQIEAAGLKSHGLVGKDSNGKVVSATEGHLYGKKKVEKVIAILKGG